MIIFGYQIVLKKKLSTSRFSKYCVIFLGISISLILSGLIFLINKKNPLEVFSSSFFAVFGSLYGITETFLIAIPIAACALAVGVAAMIKIWNIGAEGQFVAGALGAGISGIYFSYLPPVLLIPIMFCTGILFSMILGAIPGILKAILNVNEILVTLMLNYMATLFMLFLLYGPLKGFDNFPYSKHIPENTFLPLLFSSRLHTGVFIIIFIAIIVYFFMKKSIWGYELRVLGESYKAARYAGIGVKRNIILIMTLSAAIAGVGGILEVIGVQHRLQPSIAQGYGFTGIIVSWLAKNNPLTTLLVSFLIAGLFVSGSDMQISYGLPTSIIKVFQGIVFLSILASDVFTDYYIAMEKI